MAELRRICSHVDLALDDEFRESDDPRPLVALGADDTEVIRDDIDLDSLDGLIQTLLSDHQPHSAAIDREMAEELHRLLPLTRREGADRHLWAWLGMVRYPHLVAHRWKPGRDGMRSAERFVGNRVRQTFARLWWAAELTVGESSDYSLTKKLLDLRGFQDVYEAIFGRAFCQYRPAMEAFVEVVGPKPEAVMRETAKEFGYVLTTLVLEVLSPDEIRELLRDLVARVEARS